MLTVWFLFLSHEVNSAGCFVLFFIIAALVNCLLKRHLFLILDQLEVNQSDPLINLLFTA